MPKSCKNCEYKKKYQQYCKEFDLQKQIEKSKQDILKEINKNKVNYDIEPSEEMVEYYKCLLEKTEPKSKIYRFWLKMLYLLPTVSCGLLAILLLIYIIYTKQYNVLIVPVPFFLFAIDGIILLKGTKKLKEQDAYNILMAFIAIASLILAIISVIE